MSDDDRSYKIPLAPRQSLHKVHVSNAEAALADINRRGMRVVAMTMYNSFTVMFVAEKV